MVQHLTTMIDMRTTQQQVKLDVQKPTYVDDNNNSGSCVLTARRDETSKSDLTVVDFRPLVTGSVLSRT